MNWHYILLGVAFAFINFAVVYLSYSFARYLVVNSRSDAKSKAKIPDKILFIAASLFVAAIVGRLFGGVNLKSAMVYFLISGIPAMLGVWSGLKIDAKTNARGKKEFKI